MPLRPDGVVAVEDRASRIVRVGPVVGCVDQAFCEDDHRACRAAIIFHCISHTGFIGRAADIWPKRIRAAVIEVGFV